MENERKAEERERQMEKERKEREQQMENERKKEREQQMEDERKAEEHGRLMEKEWKADESKPQIEEYEDIFLHRPQDQYGQAKKQLGQKMERHVRQDPPKKTQPGHLTSASDPSLQDLGMINPTLPEKNPVGAAHNDEEKYKSTKHKAKFQNLLNPKTKLNKVDGVSVSFTKQFCIGKGSQGSVFIGLHDDGSEVAVKRVNSDDSKTSEKIGEVEILGLLNLQKSDHIVHYRGFIRGDDFSFIIVDLCEETLAGYVEQNTKEFLERRAPVIIREILTGLYALHCGVKKILHLDLKPSNILVDREGRMRLADFGISRVLAENETTVTTGVQGTAGWMAAESIPKSNSTKVRFKRKSDIQVAGMISFYVLTKGAHPFGNPTHVTITNISNGLPVNLGMLSDPIAKAFVSWLITHDIHGRPYVEEALKHPFLQSPTDHLTAHSDSSLEERSVVNATTSEQNPIVTVHNDKDHLTPPLDSSLQERSVVNQTLSEQNPIVAVHNDEDHLTPPSVSSLQERGKSKPIRTKSDCCCTLW